MTESEKNRVSERFRLVITLVILVFLIFFIWYVHLKYSERISNYELIPTRIEDYGNGMTDVFFDFKDIELHNEDLVFYSKHHLVKVYVDENLIYEDTKIGTFLGHTNGNKWNFVTLPQNAQEIKVVMNSVYGKEYTQDLKFYLGGGIQIFKTLYRESEMVLVMNFIIFLMGIFLILYWLVIQFGKTLERSMLYLGITASLVGMWLLVETNAFLLFVHDYVVVSWLAFFVLMLLPTPFLLFANSFLELKDRYVWKVITALNILEIIVLSTLQALNISDLKENVWIIQGMIGVGISYLVISLVKKVITRDVNDRVIVCLIGIALIMLVVVIDVYQYYHKTGDTDIFGCVAFIILGLMFGYQSVTNTLQAIEKGKQASEMERFALTDHMTGCYNRNAFDLYVEHLKQDKKRQDQLMIVLFDLNNLKQCNDRYGHQYGDYYIIEAAKLIDEIFGSFGRCYRIGGDEFCFISTRAKKCPVKRLATQLKNLEAKQAADADVSFQIAMGYAVRESEEDSFESLMERADALMYENKKKLKS